MKNAIPENKERKSMNLSTFTTLILVFAAWFILMRWVLPWLGVPTCMGGNCSITEHRSASPQANQIQGDNTPHANSDITG
jgi:hypothetical protein